MALSEDQNMTLDGNFGGHLATFRTETQPKVDLLRRKIIPKQLLDNSKATFKKSKI